MTKTFIILLFFGSNSFGQKIYKNIAEISSIEFRGDSINTSPNDAFNDLIKLTSIDKSNSIIDIRLYKLDSITQTVRRIFVQDSNWKVVQYEKSNTLKKVIRHKLASKSNYQKLIWSLFNNNILRLPDQDEIKDEIRKDRILNSEVISETKLIAPIKIHYTVEIKVGSKYRVYQFNNPEFYSKIYADIAEFKNFLNIVNQFQVFKVQD